MLDLNLLYTHNNEQCVECNYDNDNMKDVNVKRVSVIIHNVTIIHN